MYTKKYITKNFFTRTGYTGIKGMGKSDQMANVL